MASIRPSGDQTAFAKCWSPDWYGPTRRDRRSLMPGISVFLLALVVILCNECTTLFPARAGLPPLVAPVARMLPIAQRSLERVVDAEFQTHAQPLKSHWFG